MASPLPLPKTHSLAMAAPGDRATVEKIHFDAVRHRCRELGIGEGDVLVCEERGNGSLRLTHDSGRSVEIPLEYANYVSTWLESPMGGVPRTAPRPVGEQGRWLRPRWAPHAARPLAPAHDG